MEIEEEDEDAPVLVKAEVKKSGGKPVSNKNKRSAPDSDGEDDAEAGASTLDEMIAKEALSAQTMLNGDHKLSKKQLKKLKKNNGTPGTAPEVEIVGKKKELDLPSNKSDKKVSFAKELEQGPTPTKTQAAANNNKNEDTAKPKQPSLGVKTVQGVTIDDRKLGAGQTAKAGDRVSMRYIGKLKADNKVFDTNKKGKPFSFKLGAGEVIKGWEIGVQGTQRLFKTRRCQFEHNLVKGGS